MAAAAGMSVEDLPFAGELMEIKDAESSWRNAIEICLHALSRTVLVDCARYDELSQSIDSVRLGTRVSFRGIDVSDKTIGDYRSGGVASKLDLDKESLFVPWLSRVLADENHDALCVEDPRDLRGDDLRITKAGQMRRKFKGSHGRARGDRNVIGFSNEATIERLTKRLTQLTTEYAELSKQREEIDKRRAFAEVKSKACGRLLEISFDKIDVVGAESSVGQLTHELEEFLKGNRRLAELREQYEVAERRKIDCVKREGAAEEKLRRLNEELSTLQSEANSLDAAQFELPDDQEQHIEGLAAEKERVYPTVRDLHNAFSEFAEAMNRGNCDKRTEAEKRADADKRAIEQAFSLFQSRWWDPNRGETLESYQEYAAILAEIQHQGIDEQEAHWADKMHHWIREDLVQLRSSFDKAVQEMEDRIEPINGILADLPFGVDGGRLQISLRVKESKRVAEFKRTLNDFAGNATADFDVVSFYNDIKGFMDQIRPGSMDRDALLDRRRHVEISAKASWPAELEREDSYYNSLAGKSGGEVQELVAFILGSALLYSLGGEAGSKPVFAPVMLDEGFIKADSEFTARAVSAWKSFGFQLIVATPEDKFQSIAPYAAGCVYITKNTKGVSRVSQTKLVEKATANA